MAQGGARPGAGRPKGKPNQLNDEARKKAQEDARLASEAAKADVRAEVASARMQQEIERAANARDVFKSILDSQLQMQQSAVDNVKRTFA